MNKKLAIKILCTLLLISVAYAYVSYKLMRRHSVSTSIQVPFALNVEGIAVSEKHIFFGGGKDRIAWLWLRVNRANYQALRQLNPALFSYTFTESSKLNCIHSAQLGENWKPSAIREYLPQNAEILHVAEVDKQQFLILQVDSDTIQIIATATQKK